MEPGSWFRGRLYVHRCDLSFDGRWLVYFAFGPTREIYSWVAISQAPWLRAEVLWPKEDCWRGGGVFTGRNRLWLNLAPDARPRAGDKSPKELGLRVEQSPAAAGEDEGPFFRRLERDGWQRAGDWSEGREVATPEVLRPFGTWRRKNNEKARTTPAGWLYHGDPGWFLQPSPRHPTLRMYYRGYYLKRGRVYDYALDGFPGLLDASVEWAGWDAAHRLLVARDGMVERYTLADLERGAPSFGYDLNESSPPPRPPRPPRATPPPVEIPPAPEPGPDSEGRYVYLGDSAHLQHARGRAGHVIRSQNDLQSLALVLRATSQPPFFRPQIYVVTVEGDFLLGGELEEDVEVASGKPVLAAGEAILEEAPSGIWYISSINNRSYGYMPGASSWAAVDQGLAAAGIDYPREGFTEIYPTEGTWEDVLAVLRE